MGVLRNNNQETVLEVRNLCKVYQPSFFAKFVKKEREKVFAVNNISFSVRKGEIVGFLGANGAGKTTTLQMLLGTLKPTSGEIIYFEKDFFADQSRALQKIGFATTYASLPHRLTVYENLEVFGRLYSLSRVKRDKKIQEMLHRFSLSGLRNREMCTLSAGQMSRVMLAKAFLAEPKIVLLDEPTAALDPDVAQEIRQFIVEQTKQYGTSVLFASHNMYEVTEMCDRVIVLQNGIIIESDTPENLANRLTMSYVYLMAGIGFDLEDLINFCSENKFAYAIEGHYIEIAIAESNISSLLLGLADAGITYTNISIRTPTLEDYFIEIARASSVKG